MKPLSVLLHTLFRTNGTALSIAITNNGSETVRNWALKLDCSGEITNIWNAALVLRHISFGIWKIFFVNKSQKPHNRAICWLWNAVYFLGCNVSLQAFQVPKRQSRCTRQVSGRVFLFAVFFVLCESIFEKISGGTIHPAIFYYESLLCIPIYLVPREALSTGFDHIIFGTNIIPSATTPPTA